MDITMNPPAFLLTALLVLSLCVLLLGCAYHQFAKGVNQYEESKTWNQPNKHDIDEDDDDDHGDPADAWKKG